LIYPLGVSNQEQIMERVKLSVEGMNCGHCVAQVTKALRGVQGAVVENVAVGAADVTFDPAKTNREELTRAVTEAGYVAKAEASPAPLTCAPTEKTGCGGCH
jgi:copper chaperone